MKKIISRLSIIFISLFIISFVVFLCGKNDVWKTISITFGVTSYHFCMRIFVGTAAKKILHNNIDYTKKWFSERPFEKPLYAALNIKKWKKYMLKLTYDTDCFDIKKHSLTEIIMAGCQAEIVHEIIMLFSFLPIILIIWFQPSAVFILTSVSAALFDSIFVIMQRYN